MQLDTTHSFGYHTLCKYGKRPLSQTCKAGNNETPILSLLLELHCPLCLQLYKHVYENTTHVIRTRLHSISLHVATHNGRIESRSFIITLRSSMWGELPKMRTVGKKTGKSLHKGCRQMILQCMTLLMLAAGVTFPSLRKRTLPNTIYPLTSTEIMEFPTKDFQLSSLFPVTSNWTICAYPWQRTHAEATTPARADY